MSGVEAAETDSNRFSPHQDLEAETIEYSEETNGRHRVQERPVQVSLLLSEVQIKECGTIQVLCCQFNKEICSVTCVPHERAL